MILALWFAMVGCTAVPPMMPIPSDIPIYPGATVRGTSQSGKASLVVALETVDSPAQVDGWYRANLGAWDIDPDPGGVDAMNGQLKLHDGSRWLWVSTSQRLDPEGCGITLALGP